MSVLSDKATLPGALRSPAPFCAVVLTIVMCLLQALPSGWREWLRYERVAVGEGEVWRLVTSSVVHLGWAHLVLNATAMLIMAWLFSDDRPRIAWASDLAICAMASAGGLFLFAPQVQWVVGLSGALHGLFVVGCLAWIAAGVGMGWALLAGVAAKVAWEQWQGEMPLSGDIVGGAVITDAHLWGAVGGLFAFGLFELGRRAMSRV